MLSDNCRSSIFLSMLQNKLRKLAGTDSKKRFPQIHSKAIPTGTRMRAPPY